MTDPDCIFCKIASGQLPSNRIYQDDEVVAFHDIHPAAPVHFLLIPRLHLSSLFDVGTEHGVLLGKMLQLVPQLAREQGCEDGFRTVINTGRNGGQEVFHLHLHVMGGPRPWKKQAP